MIFFINQSYHTYFSQLMMDGTALRSEEQIAQLALYQIKINIHLSGIREQYLLSMFNGGYYKTIRYKMPKQALTVNSKKLAKQLQNYNSIQNNLSKIEFCTFVKETQEIVVGWKFDKDRETLEQMRKANREISIDYWKRVALNITEQVELLHQKGIHHGCLSLQSISVFNDIVKVDPPFFRWIEKQRRTLNLRVIFKNPFQAPQLKQGSTCSPQGDIYALGIIFTLLFTGSFISSFNAQKQPHQIAFSFLQQIEDMQIRNMIDSMISKDSYDRPNINSIRQFLSGRLSWKRQVKDAVEINAFKLFQSIEPLSFKKNDKAKAQHFNGWEVEFKNVDKSCSLISLGIESTSIKYHQFIQNRRIASYVKSGCASLKFTSDGWLKVTVPSYYKKIIDTEYNEAEIKKYLTTEEEEIVQISSSTFIKIKEQIKALGEYSSTKNYMKQNEWLLSHDLWEKIADELFGLRKQELAIKLYQKIIESSPGFEQEIDGLGCDIQYEYEGKLFEWYIYNRTTNKFKGSAFDALSLCYSITKKFEDALIWYKKMIKLYPSDYRFQFGLANIESNRGNIFQAIQIYKKIIQLKPKFDKSYQRIAQIHQSQSYDCEKCKQAYPIWVQKNLQLNPDNFIGQVLMAKSKSIVEEWMKIFQQIMLKGESQIYLKVQMALKCGEYADNDQLIEKGTNLFRQCMTKYPQSSLLHQKFFEFMSKNLKFSKKQCKQQCQKVFELNQSSWWAANKLGVLAKNEQQSKALFELSINLNPFYSYAYSNLGSILIRQKNVNFERCIANCNKSLELHSHYLWFPYQIMGICYFQKNDYQRAFSLFKKIKNQNKQSFASTSTFYHLGEIFKTKGQIFKGISHLKKVFQIQPKHITSLISLAVVYERLGKYQQALDYLLQYIAMKPNDKGARKALVRLYVYIGDVAESQKWK